MLGTVLDAGRSVRIFPFRIFLPTILDRVVALHRRALLLADAVVVEVAAGLKCEDDNDEASNDDFFHSLTFQFNRILIDCSLTQSINPTVFFKCFEKWRAGRGCLPYILAYKSRNFGQNLAIIFSIRLIRGSNFRALKYIEVF